MPANTNGVYQDKSTPSVKDCGVGRGAAYPVQAARPGMGGSQYSPKSPSYGRSMSHDKRGNSTYK